MSGTGTPAPASSLVVALNQACFAQLKSMLQCLAISVVTQLLSSNQIGFVE